MKQVNFLPEDYVEQKARRRTNVICVCLLLVVMAAVAGGFAVTEQRQRRADKQMAEINAEMAQASKSLKQLEVLEAKRQQMMTKASISASLMDPVPRSLLLATVTNALPSGVSLVEFGLDCKDVNPKSKAKKSRSRNKKKRRKKKSEEDAKPVITPKQWKTTMEVAGLAPTDIEVAKLISNLNVSPLFREVNLLFSEEYEYKCSGDLVRSFKLMLVLNPSARASEQDVAMARQTQVRGM